MTPDQQYLKDHGHKYIGAIEVEFEQSLSFHDDIWVCNRRYVMNAYMVYMLGNILPEVATPIFTPQEGEQFLKDLEEAIGVATRGAEIWHVATLNYGDGILFEDAVNSKFAYSVVVKTENISQVTYQDANGIGLSFDTAAYIDKLREKGYKV